MFAIRLLAGFLGTFRLVPGGCGSAVLAARFQGPGKGLAGVLSRALLQQDLPEPDVAGKRAASAHIENGA